METFKFDPGKFYIRRQGQVEDLCFEMLNEQWRMRKVAIFKNGEFNPSHGAYVEDLRQQSGNSGSGNFIEHALATDDDLRHFMRVYNDEHVTLSGWVKDVCEIKNLDEEEKTRIKRIATEISMEHSIEFEEIPQWKQIDMKLMTVGPINKLMKETKITRSDEGKMYVMAKDGKSGQVMTREDLLKLDAENIGGWTHIGVFDVNS